MYALNLYAPADAAACLAVFDANAPEFFAPAEREEFAEFLRAPRGVCLVLRAGAGVRGCGGYGAIGEEIVMCWGMLAREHQRRGIGRKLLEARIAAAMKRFPTALRTRVETSRRACGFYERCGFFVVAERDGTVTMTRPR